MLRDTCRVKERRGRGSAARRGTTAAPRPEKGQPQERCGRPSATTRDRLPPARGTVATFGTMMLSECDIFTILDNSPQRASIFSTKALSDLCGFTRISRASRYVSMMTYLKHEYSHSLLTLWASLFLAHTAKGAALSVSLWQDRMKRRSRKPGWFLNQRRTFLCQSHRSLTHVLSVWSGFLLDKPHANSFELQRRNNGRIILQKIEEDAQ